MTPAQRKQAERNRRRERGEVRVEIWAPRDKVESIKEIAQRLAAGDKALVRWADNVIRSKASQFEILKDEE